MNKEQSEAIIGAAIAKSAELGTAMNIALVAEDGTLKAFIREDGAWQGSADIAIKKAQTARLFTMDTASLDGLVRDNGSLYGIGVSNGGLITFPGGVSLPCGGAIGVSGSAVENDAAVAAAGASVL